MCCKSRLVFSRWGLETAMKQKAFIPLSGIDKIAVQNMCGFFFGFSQATSGKRPILARQTRPF